MEAVTSSDLVRHFGIWRDRALSRPVYVHHHGRAKLVLASVDFMEHLVSGHSAGSTAGRDVAALLDRVDGIVAVTDDRLRLLGATAAARQHLAGDLSASDTLADWLIEPIRPILLRAAADVLDGGVVERLQVRVGSRGERRVDLTVQPLGSGICITGHDRTAGDAAAMATARATAMDQTLALLGSVAALRINLRGYIVDASSSFEAMTGLPAGGYRSVRLPTLFDLPTRVSISDALEETIETLSPRSARAQLISHSGRPIPVCMAFSGELLRAGDDIVIATVVQVPPSFPDT